jgi:hypothetical protein
MKRLSILLVLLGLVILGLIFKPYIRAAPSSVIQRFAKTRTVAERVQQYGAQARGRLKPHFQRAQLAYPPGKVALVGLKAELLLQVYAAGPTNSYRFVRSYPVLAASGMPGPKLRQGDGQVPEGVYPIESLNPNSRFHLSLRIGYPSPADRAQAEREGRKDLGGDIMIHGSSVSVGCLAMGDEAAEDLFVLAADTGLQNMTVILSPVDFRRGASVPKAAKLPAWTDSLYAQIRSQLAGLPLPKPK